MIDFNELRQAVTNAVNNDRTFNSHFESDKGGVYVRVAFHLIEGTIARCLDIGRVWVNPDHQGKGLYSKLLSDMAALAKELNVVLFVENVHERSQWSIYRNRGFSEIIPVGYAELWAACFYKLPTFSIKVVNEDLEGSTCD